MRNILIFATSLVVSGMISSCTMGLDLGPKDQVSDATFWKQAKDFELAANAFYGALPAHGTADNASDMTFGSGPDAVSNGTYLVPDESSLWNDAYGAIRGINYLLTKAEEYHNKDEIKRYIGEAHFFRAWHYFNLFRSFGGVPIVLRALDLDSEELFAPRDSRADVVKLVVDDLKENAIPNLPEQSEMAAEDLGRISKGAARAFLARICLYEGTHRKYHNEEGAEELLSIAASVSHDIIESGEYDLFKEFGTDLSYRKLFIEAGEDCCEMILSRRYVKDINGTHMFTRYLEQNIMNPSRKLVDTYLCKDGLPIDKSGLYDGLATMSSEFNNRDPRMEQTIMKPGIDVYRYEEPVKYEKPVLTGYPTRTGYQCYKYLGETNASWLNNAEYDNIVLRLGEVLLIYVEAKFELDGQISDDDLNISINRLRDRVGMPHLTNAFCKANGLDMLTEIRRERTVELACEGFRYDDLIRWKTAEVEMPQSVKGIKFIGTEYQQMFPELEVGKDIFVDENGYMIAEPSTSRFFDPGKHYLKPLPKKQIKLNPNLEQNPNWQ